MHVPTVRLSFTHSVCVCVSLSLENRVRELKRSERQNPSAETSMEGPGSANQPLLSRASRPDEDGESGTCEDGGSVIASAPPPPASSSGNSVVLFSSLVAVCGSYAFGNAVSLDSFSCFSAVGSRKIASLFILSSCWMKYQLIW